MVRFRKIEMRFGEAVATLHLSGSTALYPQK